MTADLDCRKTKAQEGALLPPGGGMSIRRATALYSPSAGSAGRDWRRPCGRVLCRHAEARRPLLFRAFRGILLTIARSAANHFLISSADRDKRGFQCLGLARYGFILALYRFAGLQGQVGGSKAVCRPLSIGDNNT